MDMLAAIKAEPFFEGIPEKELALLADCGEAGTFPTGAWLLRQHAPAKHFYLLTGGLVELKAFVPQRGVVTLETLGVHEPLGWSWLVPPYQWHYDARTLEPTTALVFDAVRLRHEMEADHEFGFQLQRRVIDIMAQRLQAIRMQSLDVYGLPGGAFL
ncbi:cyclic nucleotide-binding domain-containing protein [Aquisalimonas sp.]|uniref:Crp/Fnr family transcriptional regulator n=1 Tax=Aquisalimonas sp. TaxID=1872621 RepID=UPI0025C73B6E|nr:cyclic nucleotide-binding domain-containing protein [Aquisalimonas sp.]